MDIFLLEKNIYKKSKKVNVKKWFRIFYPFINISMSGFRHQDYKNENTETKNSWYDRLISYIPELEKKQSVVLKTKL